MIRRHIILSCHFLLCGGRQIQRSVVPLKDHLAPRHSPTPSQVFAYTKEEILWRPLITTMKMMIYNGNLWKYIRWAPFRGRERVGGEGRKETKICVLYCMYSSLHMEIVSCVFYVSDTTQLTSQGNTCTFHGRVRCIHRAGTHFILVSFVNLTKLIFHETSPVPACFTSFDNSVKLWFLFEWGFSSSSNNFKHTER